MSQKLSEPEKAKQQTSPRETQPGSVPSFQDGLHPILQLQRTLGNRQVAQLIKTRRLTPQGGIIGLQRKLTVGAADDQYEQEADRVARQVVSMPDSAILASSPQTSPAEGDAGQAHILQSKPLPLAASITPLVQRRIGAEEESEEGRDKEENKEGLLQAKFFNKSTALPLQRQPATEEEETEPIQARAAGSLSDSFEAGADVESRLSQSKGDGSQLPDQVRAYMEPRFGVDFSHVRVHTGSDAIQMNRDVGAQAFTHGSDIYYGAGSSPSNQELTAHELTHVVQQNGGPLKTKRLDGASSIDTKRFIRRYQHTTSAGKTVQRNNERDTQQEQPTFEFFNLSGVLESKGNMNRRAHELASLVQIGISVGDLARNRLLAYSNKYRLAYQDYAAAIRGARVAAQDQNLYLSVVIGTACSVAAAFILPSTAAGWFALTASELATGLASGVGQATVGAGLASILQIAGGDLEPGGLSPEAQELPVWRTAANIYRTAASQIETIRNLDQVVARAEFLVGEIRTQVAGGLPTMFEEHVLDRVEALIRADQAMARLDDNGLLRGRRGLDQFQADLAALNPEGYSQQRMEQDIWILWMATLSDASVLDLNPIENRLRAVGVIGPNNSRLNIDFGFYTFYWEEDEARDAARVEAANIRATSRLPREPGG